MNIFPWCPFSKAPVWLHLAALNTSDIHIHNAPSSPTASPDLHVAPLFPSIFAQFDLIPFVEMKNP